MPAYYNEFDPQKAEWLRELMKRDLIAPGDVDERSIDDIAPNELMGYTQHHFFAGIGVWSYALRKAGWPDERPVWTASCPCQPFSSAGKGDGFDDERHLWPSLFWLIQQLRPVQVFGEQVASKDGLAWLDLVQNDLESEAYTCGAVDSCAAGYGAPMLRQRLYWMAYPESIGQQMSREKSRYALESPSNNIRLADTKCIKCGEGCVQGYIKANDEERERPASKSTRGCIVEWLADTDCKSSKRRTGSVSGEKAQVCGERIEHGSCPNGYPNGCEDKRLASTNNHRFTQGRKSQPTTGNDGVERDNVSSSKKPAACPTNGHWKDTDWLFCRDGLWRPTESIDKPLDDELANRLGYRSIGGRYSLDPLKEKAENRVMRLRGYGDAIVAEQAIAFIEAALEIENIQGEPK